MRGSVLILAGTTEARQVCAAVAGCDVIASLAGLTQNSADLSVPTRVGGFGGEAGFLAMLDGVSAVLDATHPFAGRMTERSARLCNQKGLPYLRLTRAGWPLRPGWHLHADAAAAARALPQHARAFLAVGPGSVSPFLGRGLALWCRRIDEAAPVPGVTWIVGRPPAAQAEEEALFRRLGITHLVTKNSGGTRAKLDAAEALGIAVHMIARPPATTMKDCHDIQVAIEFVRRHASPLPDYP